MIGATPYYDQGMGDVENVPTTHRPQRIVHYYLRRQVKHRGVSLAEAAHEMARQTGLSDLEILLIDEGLLPAPVQILSIIRGMRWSTMFIFGVTADNLQEEFLAFCRMAELPPTYSLRRDFVELYDRCLRQKVEEEGGLHE